MRRRSVVLVLVGAALAAPGSATAASKAFELPRAARCLDERTFSFRVLPAAKGATVRVDGAVFRRVKRPGRVRLRFLPRGRHAIVLTPTGGGASVTPIYQTCIDTRPAVVVPAGEKPMTLQVHELAPGSLRKAKKG